MRYSVPFDAIRYRLSELSRCRYFAARSVGSTIARMAVCGARDDASEPRDGKINKKGPANFAGPFSGAEART
ncbi:hypothetical protein [Paraburkholderia rhizosphaerae]|uniref:hypothetical protein n=1 Tax=Paraburkholderia rhizosphaerae TaxID=480658 RepID=UPI0010668D35|nr:hypothetical protein [Paraburkholderia rhizosphaerae]